MHTYKHMHIYIYIQEKVGGSKLLENWKKVSRFLNFFDFFFFFLILFRRMVNGSTLVNFDVRSLIIFLFAFLFASYSSPQFSSSFSASLSSSSSSFNHCILFVYFMLLFFYFPHLSRLYLPRFPRCPRFPRSFL